MNDLGCYQAAECGCVCRWYTECGRGSPAGLCLGAGVGDLWDGKAQFPAPDGLLQSGSYLDEFEECCLQPLQDSPVGEAFRYFLCGPGGRIRAYGW